MDKLAQLETPSVCKQHQKTHGDILDREEFKACSFVKYRTLAWGERKGETTKRRRRWVSFFAHSGGK